MHSIILLVVVTLQTVTTDYVRFLNDPRDTNSTVTCYHKSVEELKRIVGLNHRATENTTSKTSTSNNADCLKVQSKPGIFWQFIENVSDQELPWRCRAKRRTRELSEGLFPSHITEAVCNSCSCMFGQYRCMPVKRMVQVLILNSCRAVLKAGSISIYEERWLYEDVEVTIGCECRKRIL